MSNRERSEMTTADGRTLCWAEFGLEAGPPSCSSMAATTPDSPGASWMPPQLRTGVRLICPDRPGFGRSTFQPGRTLLDWPSDVEQLADHLGLDQFGLIGHSGGGPHALACAAALPERITRSRHRVLGRSSASDEPRAASHVPCRERVDEPPRPVPDGRTKPTPPDVPASRPVVGRMGQDAAGGRSHVPRSAARSRARSSQR